MKLISIGADIEVFLRNKKTGELESAIGRIGGSKHSPRVVPNGNLQEDNILAEFAIDPAYSKEEFISNILSVLSSLERAVPWADLDITSAHEVNRRLLDHPKALEFGCDPDFNAYVINDGPRFVQGSITRIRTAGGHVHLGIEGIKSFDIHAKGYIVKVLDHVIGRALKDLDPKSILRMELYGSLGSFRVKPYGLEYRAPSNYWIKDVSLMEWIYDGCEKVLNDLNDKEFVKNWHQMEPSEYHPLPDAHKEKIEVNRKW